MTIARKKTNPLHHNAGRSPTFNQIYSRNLAWINFTARGLIGNLKTARDGLGSVKSRREYLLLPEDERHRIISISNSISNIISHLQELDEEVRDLNASKTRIPIPSDKKN